ncbi:MAG: hypothetical protein ACR2M4_09720 [Actinomycetota bacterium]
MKQTNEELLKKCEAMKNWMVADIRRAMFSAQANFLVGMGLMNYTEIVGSFIRPDGNAGERFDAFFERLGSEYRDLLKRFNKKREKRRTCCTTICVAVLLTNT